MKLSHIILRVIAALGITFAFALGSAHAASAGDTGGYDAPECNPAHEDATGYEGYNGYDGCNDVDTTTTTAAAVTTTIASSPTTVASGPSTFALTGGVTMIAGAGVVAAIALTLRRLATS